VRLGGPLGEREALLSLRAVVAALRYAWSAHRVFHLGCGFISLKVRRQNGSKRGWR
jgi:hypothetical protein